MRYWDGRGWTQQTQPHVQGQVQQPRAAHATTPRKRSRGKTALAVGGAGVAALFVIGGIGAALSGNDSTNTAAVSDTSTTQAATSTSDAPSPSSTSSTTTSKPAATKTTPPPAPKTTTTKAAPKLTVSQEQAVLKAEDYLSYTAFSRKGLIQQLKFEGFSTADATYAVDHVSVNWNEQAAKKAEEYLSTSSFSRASLIQQLEFEGFTAKQVKYGASKVGL